MINVPIENVLTPRHLSVAGQAGSLTTTVFGDNTGRPVGILGGVKMEVYTGWVLPNFHTPSTVAREDYRTFLPTAPNKIRSYGQNNLVSATATVSPAIVTHDEDVEVLFGVDGLTSVKLEPQQFLGFQGDQNCLRLQVTLAGMNATILRFTYQVTILMEDAGEGDKDMLLQPGTVPV
jgi:hypothetical protein